MTPRGAYVARLDLDVPHHAGVVKKMRAQVAALRTALGPVDHVAVRGLSVVSDDRVLWRQAPGPFARQRLLALGFYPGLVSRLAAYDYLYIRYQRSTPMFIRMLRMLRRRNAARPVFVEIPTFPYEAEQTSRRDRALGLVDRMTRSGMRGTVDRIVTFSDRESIFGIPTIRTQNGVDLGAIRPMDAAPDHGPLRLVAVANLGLRHAYDRVIAGLAAYRGERPVVFEIIGSGSAEAGLRAQAAGLGLSRSVTFAGPLDGAPLDARLRGAHLGIAALGMHRIGTSTTDLKSREYCARGLPFVTSNPDADFGEGFEFAFKAPADDSPIDIAALVGFHDRLRARHPDFPARMRAHAEARLGWDAKMAPVIDAIRHRLRDGAA